MPDKTQETFHFEITGDYTLGIKEIWPDGDAPGNPTTEDVIARVKASCHSTRELMRDWNMGASTLIDGKDSGLSEWL